MLTKVERTELINQLTEEFSSASALYFTAYQGMTVEKFNGLRDELRKVGSSYMVIKNTLAGKALEKGEIDGIAEYLSGPIGVAIAKDDATAPAKVLKKFNKDNNDLMTMRVAYLDGTVFAGDDANKLADLPSREELYSMFLSCLQAPVTKLAGTLQGVLTGFVQTVDAVRIKKEQEN